MDQKTVDQLAEVELERHKRGMLYAERQLVKAGDYEAVANSVRRRKTVTLWFSLAVAAAFLYGGSGLWAVLVSVGAVLEYIHARRTHETLLRWQRLASEAPRRPERPDGAGPRG